MATITKRTNAKGEPAYTVRVRIKGYPPESATFRRLAEAREWAAQTEAAINERRHFPHKAAARHTFYELVDVYVNAKLVKKATSTQPTQLRQLNWWKRELSDCLLADCTPERIELALQKKSAEASDSTANRHRAILSSVFKYALKTKRWVLSNPVLATERAPEPEGRTRYLSDDELPRLLEACKASSNPWLYMAVVVALSTALRQGEQMGLTWDRVDLERGRITLYRTKNKDPRLVPVSGQALELLRAHKKVQRIDTNLLWPSPKYPKQPIDLRRPWEEALARAEIENFKWHDLRHTAATFFLASGATLGQLAELLGHRQLQMVKRYTHQSESSASELVEQMNRQFFGEGSS